MESRALPCGCERAGHHVSSRRSQVEPNEREPVIEDRAQQQQFASGHSLFSDKRCGRKALAKRLNKDCLGATCAMRRVVASDHGSSVVEKPFDVTH